MSENHILLIEDDFGWGRLLKDMLCDKGYKVSLYHTGEEAISFLHKEDPDLMILDYKLPDLNAEQIINILKNEEKPMPPFIVLTGQGDEKIAVEMFNLGALEYIIKDPEMLVQLPELIKKTLQYVNNEQRLKKAQEALRESEKELRQERKRIADIIEGTNIGTWEWNLTSGELRINKQWAAIIGYTPEEIEPANIEVWRSLVNLEDQKSGAELLEKHFSGEIEFYDIEVRMRHKTGQWIWVQERGCITRRTHDNIPLVIAGTLQDINLKKEKEELEREVKTAQEALRFKQNFLSGMSHEIRTPLTGIMGIADLLHLNPKKAPQYTQELKQLSATLNETLKQILDYAQIEWGEAKLQYSLFPCQVLFETGRKLFEKVSYNEHRLFQTQLNHKEEPEIYADRTRLVQVIETLLLYIFNNRETNRIIMNVDKADKHYTIEILYNGPVPTQEEIRMIRIPFSQTEKIDTEDYKSHILGLSLCNELIKLHAGELYFTDSAQNPFSGIQIKLPTHEPAISEPGSRPGKKATQSSSLRILLVEDQKITRKVVKILLEQMGHKVVTAQNGKEAIQVFSPDLFDLVLMDIQMPVMDGLTATRRIKDTFPQCPLIVAFSANIFEENKAKYKAAGLDDFLLKPLEEKNFLKLARKIKP